LSFLTHCFRALLFFFFPVFMWSESLSTLPWSFLSTVMLVIERFRFLFAPYIWHWLSPPLLFFFKFSSDLAPFFLQRTFFPTHFGVEKSFTPLFSRCHFPNHVPLFTPQLNTSLVTVSVVMVSRAFSFPQAGSSALPFSSPKQSCSLSVSMDIFSHINCFFSDL